MICPSCRASLPLGFALRSRSAVATCPRCGTNIAPTPESLRRAGLLIWVPAAVAGGLMIPVGAYYARMLHNWSIPLALLLALVLGIGVWSFAVSARICEFRKV
jgi:hypothetical protein